MKMLFKGRIEFDWSISRQQVIHFTVEYCSMCFRSSAYGRPRLLFIPSIIRVLKAHTESVQIPKRKLKLVCFGFIGALLVSPCRPLAQVPASLNLADMTWVEVRAAISAGFTTVIVPSGGLEQNGPHMAIGKHGWIMDEAAHHIAADIGQALIVPTIAYVPEGDTDPPTGNMRFPGTVGVSASIFEATLDGIARSLKRAGFHTICFIAEHGQSLAPQAAVARRLNAEWASDGVEIIDVNQYNDYQQQNDWLLAQGVSRVEIGDHAGIADTSELMAVHPAGVDLRRWTPLPSTPESTGVAGDPSHASAKLGRVLLAMRVDAAIRQIVAARAHTGPATAIAPRDRAPK
jgi:creatinine amidohydrolase